MNPVLPEDIRSALREAGLADFFSGCTAAHQKEYLKWIDEAKRPETRRRRIAQAMQMLAAKKAEENGRA
jgi:uncharacterized protein YdeI (YjbR/CyaY-like superfamily)